MVPQEGRDFRGLGVSLCPRVCACLTLFFRIDLHLYQLTHDSDLTDQSTWKLHEYPLQVKSERVVWIRGKRFTPRLKQLVYEWEMNDTVRGLGYPE